MVLIKILLWLVVRQSEKKQVKAWPIQYKKLAYIITVEELSDVKKMVDDMKSALPELFTEH